MMRRLSILVVALLCWLPSFAMGQGLGGDYSLKSGDWNGLQDFQILLRSLDVELVVHDKVDYNAMNPEEPWIFVYPKQDLKHRSISRFVIEGGRVLIADDFGMSDQLFTRLDLTRAMPPHGALPHDEFMQNNPALPIFRPKGVHPLLDNVKVVVANHPAVLFNVGGPVIPYEKGGGLVYDMNLGKGKVIAIADASLLINHMILLADNDKLLRNAVKYLCKGNTNRCRVHLAVGKYEQSGSFGRDEETNLLGLSKDLVESVDSFNTTVSKLMKDMPTEKLFFYLNFFLIAGLASFLYTIFPVRKTRPYSAYLSDARDKVARPQSEYDWNLSRFANGGVGTNYLLPASILKELFEELFLKAVDAWTLDNDEPKPDIVGLANRFKAQYLANMPAEQAAQLSNEAAEVLAQFARLPTRHRVFLDSDRHISERELLKLHERAMDILSIMGLKDEYERRTRSDI